ncbi:MAG: hypothetical protein AAFQ18_09645 [Pseudomonadota bacterium]
MSVYDQVVAQVNLFVRDVAEDTERYLQTVSNAEKALAVCVFGLVLMYFIINRPKTYEDGGGMQRQFLFALTIVMLFGFGLGWMYSGDIEVLVRSIPLEL